MHGIEPGMVRLNGDQQWHQCKKGTHTSIYTTGRTKKKVQLDEIHKELTQQYTSMNILDLVQQMEHLIMQVKAAASATIQSRRI